MRDLDAVRRNKIREALLGAAVMTGMIASGVMSVFGVMWVATAGFPYLALALGFLLVFAVVTVAHLSIEGYLGKEDVLDVLRHLRGMAAQAYRQRSFGFMAKEGESMGTRAKVKEAQLLQVPAGEGD